MDLPFIHDDTTPEGRPATDEEVTAVLGGMVTADGTSILDLFLECREED